MRQNTRSTIGGTRIMATNTRLIAAAPDLLAAAQSAQHLIEAWMNGILARVGVSWEKPSDHPMALQLLREAIHKATVEDHE